MLHAKAHPLPHASINHTFLFISDLFVLTNNSTPFHSFAFIYRRQMAFLFRFSKRKGLLHANTPTTRQLTFTFVFPIQQFAATQSECNIQAIEHLLPADDVTFFTVGYTRVCICVPEYVNYCNFYYTF